MCICTWIHVCVFFMLFNGYTCSHIHVATSSAEGTCMKQFLLFSLVSFWTNALSFLFVSYPFDDRVTITLFQLHSTFIKGRDAVWTMAHFLSSVCSPDCTSTAVLDAILITKAIWIQSILFVVWISPGSRRAAPSQQSCVEGGRVGGRCPQAAIAAGCPLLQAQLPACCWRG